MLLVNNKKIDAIYKNDELKPENTDKKTKTDEDYINDSEKFPLQENRYGYLPPAVETFLKRIINSVILVITIQILD